MKSMDIKEIDLIMATKALVEDGYILTPKNDDGHNAIILTREDRGVYMKFYTTETIIGYAKNWVIGDV